jgi:hypothetical protein
MRALARIAQIALFLVILIACANAAFAFVGGYMVLSGKAQPGEPMFIDDIAPSFGEASIHAFASVAVVCLAFFARARIQRWLDSASSKSEDKSS